MNKVIVVIGILICLSAVVLFAVVLSQQPPPTNENPVRRNQNELPDALYFTPVLPIFVLSSGIWMIAVGIKR
jgi:energy-converting hydrogenase Eha subunit A